MTPRLRWRRKGAYWIVLVSFGAKNPATKRPIHNWREAESLLKLLAAPGPEPQGTEISKSKSRA